MLSVGLGFMGVGLGFLVLALAVSIPTRRFLRTAVDATGTIVDLAVSSRPEGGSDRYSAVVEFPTADGTTIRWKERTASDPPVGQPGDTVAIKYDPANPERARLGTAVRLWLLPRLLGVVGTAFFVGGAIVALLALAF